MSKENFDTQIEINNEILDEDNIENIQLEEISNEEINTEQENNKKVLDNKKNSSIFKNDEEKEYYDSLPNEKAKMAWIEGWRPSPFFKGLNRDGTPRKELSYEEFLENRRLNKFGSERLNKLAKQTEEKDRVIFDLQKQVNELLKYTKQKSESEIEIRTQSLEKDEEDAILSGDLEKVKAIREIRNKLEKQKFNFSENPSQNQQINSQQNIDPNLEYKQKVAAQWRAVHNWYDTNLELQGYADGIFKNIDNNPNYGHLSFEEKLHFVTSKVQEKFPDEIGYYKPITPSSGKTGMSVSSVKSYSINDLPKDARQAYEFFAKKEKTAEGKKKLLENYIKEYSKNK